MTRHHLVFALAAILITLTAVTAVVQGQSGDYKIGVLEPLTGPLAGEGKRHLEGFEIVSDMINEPGAFLGKKLAFVDHVAHDLEALEVRSEEHTPELQSRFELVWR